MILDCSNCDARVDAEKLHSYQTQDSETYGVYDYIFAKCPSCDAPLLAVDESYAFDGDGNLLWSGPTRIYPPPAKRLDYDLPDAVRRAYGEARRCFQCKTYTAAAIMCRKCLEAICHEHGVKGRNLAQSLEELKTNGVIESRLFQWAELLRIAGNEAAHDVAADISAQDAKDLIDFTDALLQYVFTFRDRFDEFVERRAAAAKKPAAKKRGKKSGP